jgi:hypothetical protein
LTEESRMEADSAPLSASIRVDLAVMTAALRGSKS